MRKAVKQSLGKDVKGYYAFSYPTNNFGLITTFENKVATENQYCAMTECLYGFNISNNEGWLTLAGLADVGTGGPISISEKKKTKISVNAVLPKLWNAVQIEDGVDNVREVKTTLEIGPAHKRFLNKMKFEDYINSLPQDNRYKQKYESGNLILITSDIVVENLFVKIEVGDSLSTILDAGIKSGQIVENLGKVDLNAKFEKTSYGTYELTINRPVIVLRLAKEPPSIKSLIPSKNFDDWLLVRGQIVKTVAPKTSNKVN